MNMSLLEGNVQLIGARIGAFRPAAALILGSGWGEAARAFKLVESIPYDQIPGLGATGVQGHAGVMHAAFFETLPLFVFEGRRHWYEGAGWEPVAIPVFLSKQFGAGTLILTNAAGGIRGDLKVGDLMAIDDHINAMGGSPLLGPHDGRWGARFPDQTAVYDPRCRRLLERAAARIGETLPHGIYLASSGPAYETPAEIRAYRSLGADAVGMSTVPEAILAHAAGLRVAALSCITNLAAGLGDTPLAHADVLEQTRRNRSRMAALLTAFLGELRAEPAAGCL
jgi:purine-nucleoside phosphorylase